VTSGDVYRELDTLCKRQGLRLLLCGDRDHQTFRGKPAAHKLTTIDVKNRDELVVRVSLREHTLDSAALVAITALEKAGIR
jgi:hypothetical protein